MNAPQVHLMLNHVPVLGILFVTVALAAGIWFRQGNLLRFALFVLVAISLAAIPVYFSGGQSEETIERLANVQSSSIDWHEDVARVATLGLGALGLGALVALIRYRRRGIPSTVAAALLAGAIVLSGALAWTAHLGGQIRHPELRGTASAGTAPAEVDREHERD